jgi:hypothetical protein
MEVVKALDDLIFKRLGMEWCLIVVFVVSERMASPIGSRKKDVKLNIIWCRDWQKFLFGMNYINYA